MKILYHHRTRATDAQRVHILEIVNAFRQLGHEVDIASLVKTERDDSHDASKEAGESGWKRLAVRIPFAYEAMQLAYNVFAVPWLLWRLRRRPADLIYERYSLFNCAGVIAGWLSGRPVVLEANSPFAVEQHTHREIRAIGLARWMERRICNSATKVIVVSGPLRRMMIEGGVDESKLALVTNGVNLEHLDSAGDVSALAESLSLSGKVIIGFVGWFRPWHGLEFLMDAFVSARLAEQNAALLFVGDGPAMASLRTRAQVLDAGTSVIFSGPVAHERIPAYLKLIDVAVQPAANQYCCPMKIIEYMGAAKAIAAPRQENIEELLIDGEDALLFPPGNMQALAAVLRLLATNETLRRRLGDRARTAIYRRGLLWTKNAERVIRMIAGPHHEGQGTREGMTIGRRE